MPRKVPEEVAKNEVNQSSLALKILRHWQEHRPKMCAEMEKANTLYQSVWAVAKRTADILVNLTHVGLNSATSVQIYKGDTLTTEQERSLDELFDRDPNREPLRDHLRPFIAAPRKPLGRPKRAIEFNQKPEQGETDLAPKLKK